jgi:hypothetical protein
MSGTGTIEGIGITIGFGSIAAILNLVSINMDGVSVADIDCSDQSTTGGVEYVAATLIEGGTFTCGVNWNVRDQSVLMAAIGTTDTITFTYPKNTSGATTQGSHSFSGYINNISETGEIGDLARGTLTFKVAGTITTVSES